MAALTGRTLVITVSATDYTAQVASYAIEADDADSDKITFAEAAAGGGRKYVLKLELTQDMISTSLWTKIWESAGNDVPVLLKPYGNATASATQPHFSATANVREPNGTLVGGEANADPNNRFFVEVEWPLTAKPTRVTT